MASIETRQNPGGQSHRVIWREDAVKQGETFPSRKAAEQFKKLVEGHGNRWPIGWVRGKGFTETRSAAPTFAEYAERAISSRARANDRTRHDYRRDVALHLEPWFGRMQLDEITREDVGQWLIEISKKSSPKTVKNVHNLASSIMSDAIDAGLIARNVFRGAAGQLPAVKNEEMVFLSRPEFDTLLAHVVEDSRPLVLTLAMTGLRWSEATALTVADIDLLHRKTISVTKAWKRTPEGSFEIGEPKSRRSRRTIAINRDLIEALVPLVASRQGDEWLFTTLHDRAVLHSNFRNRVWLKAVKAMQRCEHHSDSTRPCGCEGTVPKTPRIHDLRHSHASWLIAAGVPLPAIQRRLGHESITTTIDRYGHLSPEMDDTISVALDRSREAVDLLDV